MKRYKKVPFKNFSQDEHKIWRTLFRRQAELRDRQMPPIFFQGIPVEGLEEDESFYQMPSERELYDCPDHFEGILG